MSAAMLFGKLPACGDFVARGLSPPERAWWDERLSIGTADARAAAPEAWEAAWDAAPPWRFRLRRAGGLVSGALALSRDRAGRRFPLVLARRDGGGAAACAKALAQGLAAGLDADALVAAVAGPDGDGSEPLGWWPTDDAGAVVREDDPARIVPAMLVRA